MHMAELLAGLPGTAYSARRSLHDARHILQAKKAIRVAIEAQMQGLGFSVVELLSSCPTNWRMAPDEALRWVEEQMVPVYPLGDYKVLPELEKMTKRGRKQT
jgi:2-oxoglutarate ferredoxin oxidoreductase subunit beta